MTLTSNALKPFGVRRCHCISQSSCHVTPTQPTVQATVWQNIPQSLYFSLFAPQYMRIYYDDVFGAWWQQPDVTAMGRGKHRRVEVLSLVPWRSPRPLHRSDPAKLPFPIGPTRRSVLCCAVRFDSIQFRLCCWYFLIRRTGLQPFPPPLLPPATPSPH